MLELLFLVIGWFVLFIIVDEYRNKKLKESNKDVKVSKDKSE